MRGIIARTMYESRKQSILPGRAFAWRMIRHLAAAILLIAIIVAIGVIGHMLCEPMNLHDALLNTALVVSGIGPYVLPETIMGKVFLAFYSLLVGLTLITTSGLLLAPIAHRILHRLHLDDD